MSRANIPQVRNSMLSYVPLAQKVEHLTCLNKLEGSREGNLTYQEGNELVYGEPADREFKPHFKHH